MNIKQVSVVVAAYNVEKFLPRCIESIFGQTERSLEILIINDGSTDETSTLADHYASIDSRVRVIHQENKGLSGARNAGLAAATGKFICFLDSDDWFDPSMVETMVQWCERYQCEVAIAGVIVDFHDEAENLISSERRVPVQVQQVIAAGTPLSTDMVDEKFVNLLGYAWNKVYLREWLLGLDIVFEPGLRLVEDIDFNSRVLSKAEKVVLVPSAFVHYVQRPRPTLGTARDEHFLTLSLKAIQKVDSLLETWEVDREVRKRRVARAGGFALWAALKASASTLEPQRSLKMMLANPEAIQLVRIARELPSAGWRGQWATFTIGRRWHRAALLPILGLRETRKLARCLRFSS